MFGGLFDLEFGENGWSYVLAIKLGARLTKNGETQVTVEYHNENGAMVPLHVHTVFVSIQRDEIVTNEWSCCSGTKESIIKPVIPEKYPNENIIFQHPLSHFSYHLFHQ